MLSHKSQEDTAFAFNGTLLARVEGNEVQFKVAVLPEDSTVRDMLSIKYKSSTEDSYADACDKKQSYRDRIYRDLHVYHMYREDPEMAHKISNGVTKKQNMQLMCAKYDRAREDPFKLKANREFLFMQKILLREANCEELQETPLKCFVDTKRILMWDDELYFPSAQAQVEKVQMSSEPNRNFVLVQINSVIYKYDLVTKDLLFKWKTQDNSEIILFYKDDKLCTVAKDTVRVWDFEDAFEQPPSIWATEELDRKTLVDRVFINEGSFDETQTEQKNPVFYAVVMGSLLRVYTNRLNRTNVEIPFEDETVTSACYSETNNVLFLGTSKGQVRFVNLLECLEVDTE